MFKKGEYVVYGSKGVCRIQDIAPVDMPGADGDRLCYIMHPVTGSGGSATVYLPVDSEKATIRRVMTREEAGQLIAEIPQIDELTVSDERKREASYKDALRTCSGRAWVSMLKTLYFRKRERAAAGKRVTALDERYLRAAQAELFGELSVVLDVPMEDMESYIYEHLEG